MTGLLVALLLLAVAQGAGGSGGGGMMPEPLPSPGLLPADGRTAELAPLGESARMELATQACAMLSAGSLTGAQLATELAKAAYPAVDFPPPPNRTASHAKEWQAINAWVQQLSAEAAAANKSLCDYLKTGDGGTDDPSNGGGPVAPGGAVINPGALPTTTPQPGRLYLIQGGTNLLSTAGAAYGVGSGSQRLALSKLINDHPANANKRFRPPSGTFETNNYPNGVLSFGVPYQTIFIPSV